LEKLTDTIGVFSKKAMGKGIYVCDNPEGG
jgi:hypothetical protein